jgi:hypothetical protein
MGKKTLLFRSIFFIFLLIINLVLLLVSEFVQEWFSGDSGACSWKGDSTGVYSSSCISHQLYTNSECHDTYYECDCCDDIDDDSYELSSLSYCSATFPIAMTFSCLLMIGYVFSLMGNDAIIDSFLFANLGLLAGLFITFITCLVISSDMEYHAGMVIRIVDIVFLVILSCCSGVFTSMCCQGGGGGYRTEYIAVSVAVVSSN